MILVSATWTGLYLAKRITRPVQRAGGRRARDRRRPSRSPHRAGDARRVRLAGRGVQHDGGRAGGEPAQARAVQARSRTQERAARRAPPLHRNRARADRDRRDLARSPTDGSKRSTARRCGCSKSIARRRRPRRDVFQREDLRPLETCSARRAPAPAPAAQEVALAREGRELHLAAAATPLLREDGSFAGAVLVFDDVTPLIRTQRVAAWRDVARRLAHEIKNPLTPIQLCAERMRRHFHRRAAAGARAGRGVHDDDRRGSRVAEGAGRRVRAVRADAGAENGAIGSERRAERDAGALQRTVPGDSDRAAAPTTLPPVRVDLEQMRRVVINLVDNAVEALGGSTAARPNGDAPTIVVETRHDP